MYLRFRSQRLSLQQPQTQKEAYRRSDEEAFVSTPLPQFRVLFFQLLIQDKLR